MFEIKHYSISDDLKRCISGENETVFRLLESRFSITIQTRESGLNITSSRGNFSEIFAVLDRLKMAARNGQAIDQSFVEKFLGPKELSNLGNLEEASTAPIFRTRYGVSIFAKTKAQAELVKAIEKNDILFAQGPAGTGKTFLAVTLAVSQLERREVERICLVRPAVEAGESLGFLPGDLKEKIAPYLRPIQDSLGELLPVEKLRKYEESGAIEVAPLAYMRGRTLKRAFIILDEAQNTTLEQMKMFLTRLGPHSKAIITGDPTQVDLAKEQKSGFIHAMKILKNIQGIAQINFTATDCLRHHLVKDILLAYQQKDD